MATQTRYPTKDAMMEKKFSGSYSGWNGKDNHLPVGTAKDQLSKFRSVVYFNIDFTPMVSVDSAVLTLYHFQGDNSLAHCKQTSPPSKIYIARMNKDWGEESATPNEGQTAQGLAYGWDNRSSSYVDSSIVEVSGIDIYGSAYTNVNITQIVNDWFGGANNYGIILFHGKEAATDDDDAVQFYSRSATDSAYRPKLVVTYTENTPPDKPTLISPANENIINELVPSLTGEANDSDSGDYITGVSVVVKEGIYRYKYSTNTTMADPGSGYIRINTSGNALAISKTDYDGNAIDVSRIAKSITVDNNSNGTYNYFVRYFSATESSSYAILSYMAGSSVNGTLLNNDVVTIYPYYESAWDSGTIDIANAPTSFSVLYGSTGTASPLTGGKYYKWSANTRDRALALSPTSDNAYFRTNSIPNAPTVTIVSSPSNDILDSTPDINITHSDNDAADYLMYGYDVIVEKETSPGSGSWTSTGGWASGGTNVTPQVSSTTITIPTALSWGGSYRVCAKTKDSSGTYGPYSQWVYFAIHQTAKAISMSPSLSATTSASPTFIGARGDSRDIITGYTIYLEQYPYTGSPVLNTTYTDGIAAGGTAFSKNASLSLTASTQYRWKVKLSSTLGGDSEWSDWNYFSTSDSATPYISSPLGDNSYTITPTITVQRVSGTFNAMQYEIYPSSSTDSNLGTAHYQSSTITFSSASSYSLTYGGTALVYSTYYNTRARVSANGGSTWSSWSGLAQFTTKSTGAPTLTSVDGNANTSNLWISSRQPTFAISRYGTDTIDYMQVQVLSSADQSVVWDSGMTNVTNGTSASITISDAYLTEGTTYGWRAFYKDTAGVVSAYATSSFTFRVNASPSIPSEIIPGYGSGPGGVFTFANTLLPTFQAKFEDEDKATYSDAPSSWYIIIEGYNGGIWSSSYTKKITSGLSSDVNSYAWTTSDYTFVYDTTYQWRTFFKDSKGATGAYTPSYAFIMSTSPNGTWSSPAANDFASKATISTLTPTLTWSYSGGTQYSFSINIEELDSEGGPVAGSSRVISSITSSHSYTIPSSGFFANGKNYKLTLTVKNTAGIADVSPSEVYIYIQQNAPDAIIDVATDTSNGHSVMVSWRASSVNSDKFTAYKIQRRVVGDTQWDVIGYVKSQTVNKYEDWYSGNNINYQYKVTVLAQTGNDGVDVESPEDTGGDSITTGRIDGDIWQFIPVNRSTSYMQELPVVDSSYSKIIQQESFETLGSTRKTIIRGFVLGDEGSITCVWKNEDVPSPGDSQVYYNETIIGRRLLDYISRNKGPHILKSPFGDVWDVQFEGPEITWLPGGILQASISWVETGTEGETAI